MYSKASERLVAAVERVVPCAHLYWPAGAAPELPWAVYEDEPSGCGADGGNWAVRHRWAVSLYEKSPDPGIERALFDSLRAEYGYVSPPEEAWVDSEMCSVSTYRFQEIEAEAEALVEDDKDQTEERN